MDGLLLTLFGVTVGLLVAGLILGSIFVWPGHKCLAIDLLLLVALTSPALALGLSAHALGKRRPILIQNLLLYPEGE